MKEFIIDLYKNPNFPMYCGIAIAVLASLFILIYVIGKKDKKKFDETQALKLQELQAKEAENNMTVAKLDNFSAPVEPVNIAPVQEEPAIPRLEDVPINTVPLPDTTPSVPEVVPVINPDDVPATPEYATLKTDVNPVDNNAYRTNDNVNEIKETVPKFQMEPNIEPVIPENTIEQMRNLNNELNNEITELEQVIAPTVAPVEVISETLDIAPSVPVVETAPPVQSVPVQPVQTVPASKAPTQPRPQIFSAVNVPKPTVVEPINMPVNNIDEIDSL